MHNYPHILQIPHESDHSKHSKHPEDSKDLDGPDAAGSDEDADQTQDIYQGIKDIHRVRNVGEEAEWNNLQTHFCDKDRGEHNVCSYIEFWRSIR